MVVKHNILSFNFIQRLIVIVATIAFATNATAQDESRSKQKMAREQINVFWILNFAKYVQWPVDSISEYTIGVYGYSTDEFRRLKTIQANGGTIQGKKFKTIKFSKVANIEYSHILFVHNAYLDVLPAINEKIGNAPTLLIADSCTAEDNNLYVVNLMRKSRSNQFQVNIDKANQIGLKISDKVVLEGGSRSDVDKMNKEMENLLIRKEEELRDKEIELEERKSDLWQIQMTNELQEQENTRKEREIGEMENAISKQERIADSLMKAAAVLQNKLAIDKAALDQQLEEKFQKEEIHKKSQIEFNDTRDKVKQREISLDDQRKIYENKKQRSAQNQRELNLITIGILILIILTIIVFINNHLNRQRNRELVVLNNRVDKQKEHIRSQSEQLKLINKELAKLSIVASQTDNGVVIMNNIGDVEWVNHGFEQLTKMDFDYLKANNLLTLTSLYKANKQIDKIKDRCINNHEPITFESSFRTNDGQDIWLQSTLTPILNENNEISRLVTIDTDITKIKEQEQSIIAQGKTLSLQRDELAQQKEFISEQLDNINTSIKYAKTIQDTIMPLEVNLSKYFKYIDVFIPLQTISGDFYWFTRVPDKENLTYTAAIDCSGHGVPGAFMTVIGARLLSEIIVEHNILDPKDILTQLNINLVKALKQDVGDETAEINNDSMELCLCKFDRKTDTDYELTFSGARRPLYVYRSDTKEFVTLKGDRKTIGGMKSKRNVSVNFTDQTIMLKTNDIVYHTTDGFADQYSANMKKYGTENFVEFLKKHAHRDLAIQKELIINEFEKQVKDSSQTDDITVFAVKLI